MNKQTHDPTLWKVQPSTLAEDMIEARKLVGDQKWKSLSRADKIELTKYLKFKGDIGLPGQEEDIEAISALQYYKEGGDTKQTTKNNKMAKKYKYGHGGETDSISMTDQMHEAKEVIGAKKWDSLSEEEKVSLTKYLVMKGDVQGDGEDYYYAKGGKPEPKPLSDSALKKIEGFQERKRARGEQTEGTLVARVIENEYKRRNEPKVIHTQFEEEEFEYADGGGVKEGDVVWVVDMGGVIEVLQDSTYKNAIKQYKKSDHWKQTVDEERRKVFVNEDKDKVTFRKKNVYAHGGSVYRSDDVTLRKSPSISATVFPVGVKRMGNDGNIWEIVEDKRGVHRWRITRDTFAHGGAPGRHRKQTIEEKAMESVGSATWFQLDKETQAGVIADMLSIGALPQRMAKGAKVEDKEDLVKTLYDMANELFNGHINNGGDLDYPEKEYGYLADELEDVEIGYFKDDSVDSDYAQELRDNGFTLTADEAIDVLEHRIAEINDYLGEKMAKGAKVKGGEFTVTYELLDGKKVVENYGTEQEMDEGIANFYIMNDVKDAIVGGAKEPEVVKEEVKEVKAEEKPKKKGLFDTEKAAPKVSKSKETAPIVHVDGLEKEIQRYDELKAIIKNADSEKEVIGGLIKDVAKDKYLEVYEQMGKRPTSIILESGGTEISYTVLDKYKIVTPEKETVLKEYDDLLGTDYTFTFDNEILDKKGKNGEKIADIINELIENSEDIPDDLKSKLVKITKKVGVKKGSIERLLAYGSPSEILQVIEPVEMLK